MFYVKDHVSDTVELSIAVNANNVFCRCPLCNAEVAVDLKEVLSEERAQIEDTSVVCDNCAGKVWADYEQTINA